MASFRSLMFTSTPLRVVTPSLVTVTTGICWAVSFTIRTFGTSTSMPNSITWAVSMKMISRTSTTSTNGVTLISERLDPPARLRDPYPPPLREKAMALFSAAALGEVQKLHREVVHARAQFPDAVAEVVIEDSRRDGRRQAHRRGNQRLGDAR